MPGGTLHVGRAILRAGHVIWIIHSAFLAPDIVEAIIKGRQEPEVSLASFLENVPLGWTEQFAKITEGQGA